MRPPTYWSKPFQSQFEQVGAVANGHETTRKSQFDQQKQQCPSRSALPSTRNSSIIGNSTDDEPRRREISDGNFEVREDTVIIAHATREGPTRWTEVAWRIKEHVGIQRPVASCSKRWNELRIKQRKLHRAP